MLKSAFAHGRLPTSDTLLRVYDRLLRAAPVGLTVVTPTGQVLVMNEHQASFAACPWVVDPRINLLTDPSVPQPVRSGLRHVFDQRASDVAVRLVPFEFAPDGPAIETWVVGIAEGTHLLGAVLLQHERIHHRPDRDEPSERSVSDNDPDDERAYLSIPLLTQRFRLTDREGEVVEAICDELATDEIAARLKISTHTVKDYVKRIQRKMGVSNRLGIAVRALKAGLVRD